MGDILTCISEMRYSGGGGTIYICELYLVKEKK